MQIFSGLSPRSNAVKRGHQPDSVSGLELIHQLNARLTVSQSRATTHTPSPSLQASVTNRDQRSATQWLPVLHGGKWRRWSAGGEHRVASTHTGI